MKFETAYEQVGLVTYLLNHCTNRTRMTVKDIKRWIFPAIMHERIYFAFDNSGIPIAYWTWAHLAPDVEKQLTAHPDFLLHESEWNEGKTLWIIDFVAPFGYVRDIVHYMEIEHFPNNTFAKARRSRKEGVPCRVVTWCARRRGSYDQYSGRGTTYRLHRSAFAKSYTEWRNNKDRPSTAF